MRKVISLIGLLALMFAIESISTQVISVPEIIEILRSTLQIELSPDAGRMDLALWGPA